MRDAHSGARVGGLWIAAVSGLAVATLLGCGGEEPEAGAAPDGGRAGGPPAADTAAALPAPGNPAAAGEDSGPGTGSAGQPREEWTAGITSVEAAVTGVAVLARVETGRHQDYDRVVFEFVDQVPAYHIEYVDRPVRQCGSGNPVPLEGDAWLAVRLEPANAHTEAGEPTVAPRERKPGLPVILELELTCDFEAQVEWVLGVASPNRYRVLVLEGPPRLVVDVRH